MSQTEQFIRDLKARLNPLTDKGYDYAEIGALLGMSKQAAIQNIRHKQGDCPKCLRKLKTKLKSSKTL